MSRAVPPIPPPLGTNTGNPSSPNRTDSILVDITNNATTTNVVWNVVNEDLPQLLDAKGGFDVTNVPAFDVEDFSRVTKVKAFMASAEDEPSVGKNDAKSGQWVKITMKKVQRLISMTDGDERKHVLDYTHVDLHYVKDQRKNLLNKF
nr:retrovirus-related Pol polyprotein from transposon TNT 1-94 [Tanacetum cinerariifolium]